MMCLQGIIGITSLSSARLSIHVALGGLAAAALAAHDTVVFGLLELRQAPILQLLLAPPARDHRNMMQASAALQHCRHAGSHASYLA